MSGRRIPGFIGIAILLLATVAAQATSHVRIVRLSYVDGGVQMERASGQGLERAMLNSPVVEGSRIVTGPSGLAEVEFENNTTARLGEATDVRFTELVINDAGDKVNQIELVRGTLYFDTRSAKSDINRVVASGRTFVLRHNSQVRFLMLGDQVQVAVFNGEARVENNAQIVTIRKNETLTADSTNPNGVLLAKGVDSLPLDKWSNERAAYQTTYSYNNSAPFGSPNIGGFGYQDLAYYGNFFTVPGYGLAWQPYGIDSWLGWNPYLVGAWALTPGFGYVWSSAYPWGWMPYHYGAWAYTAGAGWFWYPGNALNGGGIVTNWAPTAPVVKGPAGYTAPTRPVASPAGPSPSVIAVGRIGNSPAYLPDGVVPPNFRGVITDHSGLAGTANPMPGSMLRSGSTAAQNSRAFSAPARSYASPTYASQNGHVFAPPASSMMRGGYGLAQQGSGWGSSGWGGYSAPTAGLPAHGTSHASSSAHGGSTPK